MIAVGTFMDTNTLKLKCPHCGAVLLVKRISGLENKIIPCLVCKNAYKFSEYKVIQQSSNKVEDPTIPILGGKENLTQPGGQQVWYIGKLRQKASRSKDYQLHLGINTLGRAAQTSRASIQIVTDDAYMSRMHCAIEVHKLPSGGYVHYFFNTENKNSTFVNGVKVENGDRMILCGGESIRMANTEVQFVVEGEDETLC